MGYHSVIGFIFFIFIVVSIIFLIKIKVTNKGIALLEKALTAVLSAFIFSAFVVNAVGMPIIVALIFSFPIFLTIGGFLSFFVDVYLSKLNFNDTFYKYITGLLLYVISSFLIVSLFFYIQFSFVGDINIFLFNVFMISVIPALLFYHISLLFKAILKKEVTLIKDK